MANAKVKFDTKLYNECVKQWKANKRINNVLFFKLPPRKTSESIMQVLRFLEQHEPSDFANHLSELTLIAYNLSGLKEAVVILKCIFIELKASQEEMSAANIGVDKFAIVITHLRCLLDSYEAETLDCIQLFYGIDAKNDKLVQDCLHLKTKIFDEEMAKEKEVRYLSHAHGLMKQCVVRLRTVLQWLIPFSHALNSKLTEFHTFKMITKSLLHVSINNNIIPKKWVVFAWRWQHKNCDFVNIGVTSSLHENAMVGCAPMKYEYYCSAYEGVSRSCSRIYQVARLLPLREILHVEQRQWPRRKPRDHYF